MDEVSHKPSKEERKARAARERVLNRILGNDNVKPQGFADPAQMFN